MKQLLFLSIFFVSQQINAQIQRGDTPQNNKPTVSIDRQNTTISKPKENTDSLQTKKEDTTIAKDTSTIDNRLKKLELEFLKLNDDYTKIQYDFNQTKTNLLNAKKQRQTAWAFQITGTTLGFLISSIGANNGNIVMANTGFVIIGSGNLLGLIYHVKAWGFIGKAGSPPKRYYAY
jgi:uncharacterized protein YpuA (DUF1002 family)